jgi:hypothetical protein
VQKIYATITIDECQRLYASIHALIAPIWMQKEGGQVFEWFVDIDQKTKSRYIPNFKIVYLAICYFILFYYFLTCMLLIDLCSTTFICKVFHFVHLISWHFHYSKMK